MSRARCRFFTQKVKAGAEGNSQISGAAHGCIWWGCSQDLGKLRESLLKVINIQTAGGTP